MARMTDHDRLWRAYELLNKASDLLEACQRGERKVDALRETTLTARSMAERLALPQEPTQEPEGAQKPEREQVHDEQIAPLMAQVIDLCKQHDIPIVACFQLSEGDSPLASSTVIVPEWAGVSIKRLGFYLANDYMAGVPRP